MVLLFKSDSEFAFFVMFVKFLLLSIAQCGFYQSKHYCEDFSQQCDYLCENLLSQSMNGSHHAILSPAQFGQGDRKPCRTRMAVRAPPIGSGTTSPRKDDSPARSASANADRCSHLKHTLRPNSHSVQTSPQTSP